MLPLAGRTVALTRPRDQAETLAVALEALGATVVLAPLQAIVPLDDYSHLSAALPALADCDDYVFISPNAVEQALSRIPPDGLNPGARFIGMGPATAKALARYGHLKVLLPAGPFDSETLLADPALAEVAGRSVTIFRGMGGRELLAQTLAARGARVRLLDCYRRELPPGTGALLQERLSYGRLDAVVVTSSEALRSLPAVLGAAGLAQLRRCLLVVPHPRIAIAAESLGFQVRLAARPGDPGIIEALLEPMT